MQISIRVDARDLAALERIGQAAMPVPANRNEMIGAAVREYVERHAQPAQSGRPGPGRSPGDREVDASRRETLKRAGLPLEPAKARKRK